MLNSEIHIVKTHGGCVDFLSTCNPLKHASSAICTDMKAAGSRSFNLVSQDSFIDADPPNLGALRQHVQGWDRNGCEQRYNGFRHRTSHLSKIKEQELSVRLPLSLLMVMQIRDTPLTPAELGSSPHSQWMSYFGKGTASLRKCQSVFWVPRQKKQPFFFTSRFYYVLIYSKNW